MIISMALNQTGRIDVVFNATAPLVKEYGPGKHAADLTTKEFMVPLTTIVKSNFTKAHAGVQCRSLGLAGAAQRLRARRHVRLDLLNCRARGHPACIYSGP